MYNTLNSQHLRSDGETKISENITQPQSLVIQDSRVYISVTDMCSAMLLHCSSVNNCGNFNSPSIENRMNIRQSSSRSYRA